MLQRQPGGTYRMPLSFGETSGTKNVPAGIGDVSNIRILE